MDKKAIKKNVVGGYQDIGIIKPLEQATERNYLQDLSKIQDFDISDINYMKITWLKVLRLPIHPSNQDEFDLLSHWQTVLSTFNVWGNKFVFLLLRTDGETSIYFGVTSNSNQMMTHTAVKQIRQATSASIPGIEVENLSDKDALDAITNKLLDMESVGTITGMPSFRDTESVKKIQTLDALAFGFKGEHDIHTDYATLIVAEPVSETDINDIVSKLRNFATEVHSLVKRNQGENYGKSNGFNVGTSSQLGDMVGGGAPGLFGLSAGYSSTTSYGQSMSKELLNKSAEYTEHAIEEYIERLKKGRNLGFWNVGVYVLAKSNNDVKTVLGILKSIYSGENSYIEPIRANVLNRKAINFVRSFNLVPYPFNEADVHPFGKHFNYISTPMNTEELSIASSLPRRDVPGIRFSKTAVRFATNPAEVKDDALEIGNVLDMGVVQNKTYKMDPDALVRHALVAGCTGSGKSTTCKRFLSEIDKRSIPSLIIEPAKDDYVRWAIEYNRNIDKDDSLSPDEKEAMKYDIYMPGVKVLDGYKMKKLKLNPFEPAAIKGAPIDLMSRYEQAVTIINASIPASDVLPILIDESIYRYMEKSFNRDLYESESEQRLEYPKISGVINVAKEVLAQRNYDSKVQNDIAAALETRFNYLSRGKRGEILDVRKSTDYNKLFNKRVVVNLSRLIGTKDKALIMSFLLVALYEYRISAYNYDDIYRKKANDNKLLHLTLIEEAHNLLQNPENDFSGSGNPQKVSAEMFTNILSEIRSYGQGLIIVDQVPTRLIPDAIKNTNYKIIHRLTSADDSNAVASSMALTPDQVDIISKLKIGETIIFGDLDDAALWVKVKRGDKS